MENYAIINGEKMLLSDRFVEILLDEKITIKNMKLKILKFVQII